ncbi:hypothetical protein [Pseudomonas sp. R5(2019)]|uniref:hypothetical protein n=1 Tax=Pseudomonas sp. R5(2019) TaxID=2697566 RepID=UPI0014127845|nr:hypothetical protein [Pseudomonas sp. R5(2019)]NBA95177.1 hypothetical protein [Pseudomonas sp. R5(2019)]
MPSHSVQGAAQALRWRIGLGLALVGAVGAVGAGGGAVAAQLKASLGQFRA